MLWGISSFGRAPALHAGGERFESAILHHFPLRTSHSNALQDLRSSTRRVWGFEADGDSL